MPRGSNRYFRNAEDERFETEAFAYMNEEEDSTPENEQESGNEDSEPEAVQEKPETESDNEAPDDVGFHDSRQSVLSQLRTAMRQVDAEKQMKKDKRKQLDAQFKEQKVKKQKELSDTKLPEDFLESIDDAIPQKVQNTEGKRYPGGGKRRKRHGQTKVSVPVEKTKSKRQTSKGESPSEDYISFTDRSSGVQISDLKFVDRQSKSMAEIAAAFKHNRLYGKDIKRESNQSRLSRIEKRRHRLR